MVNKVSAIENSLGIYELSQFKPKIYENCKLSLPLYKKGPQCCSPFYIII